MAAPPTAARRSPLGARRRPRRRQRRIAFAAQALSELHRVLGSGVRLEVGEVLVDLHFVSLSRLRSLASTAGFRFDKRDGSPRTYFARFIA